MIEDREIRSVFAQVLKADDPLTWGEDFDFRCGAVDSLDMVNIALKLEEASGLRIPDPDFDVIRTLHDVKQVLIRLAGSALS